MDQRIKDLFTVAKSILPKSYSPYSNFKVAASVRTECSEIFAGINVENASFRLTCCAEQTAIATMVTQGKQTITEVLVLTEGPEVCPPCGACRQTILEFAKPDCMIHLCTLSGTCRSFSLNELLPHSYGAEHLT